MIIRNMFLTFLVTKFLFFKQPPVVAAHVRRTEAAQLYQTYLNGKVI